MRGDPAVIERLIGYVRIELTGQKQYMLHAACCRRWGYERLAARQEAYAVEEAQHAARLLDRILLLGGVPDLADAAEITAPRGVPAQLARDHELVSRAIAHLTAAIAVCRERADEGSRTLLDEMLVDEEAHIDWLEKQLGLLEALGVETYLQASMHRAPA